MARSSLLLSLLVACGQSHVPADGVDAGVVGSDAGRTPMTSPDAGGDRMPEPPCEPVNGDVDLLFVVDNSNSLTEEQTNLTIQLPRMMEVLTTGDLDLDGTEDFPPARSIQVGVISTDMGTGGFLIPTCADANFGDDGILRTRGNNSISGCEDSYPRFQTLDPSTGQASDDFAQDVSCVASLGTNGCGFEQQLEAMLKAVSPSSSPTTFSMGTPGHGDVVNAGFLRPNALLAVVMLTDEDDCSAVDPDLFNPSSSRYVGDLNLRCFQYPGAVHPTERFAQGLIAAKGDPSKVVFSAIVGIPESLGGAQDYDRILSDPDMQEQIDPTQPFRLRPSCNRPGTGLAFPPRRIIEVAQQLERAGATSHLESICTDDFAPAVTGIIEELATRLNTECR